MAVYLTAPSLGVPPPAHTLTDAAQHARESVERYAATRRASRAAGDGLEITTGPHPREEAERIDVATLTGSPKTTAAKLAAIGATLAATRAVSGEALSVWALMHDGRFVRAMYRRTATGWGSQGVIIDRMHYGITAALAALSEPKP